jgi:predicted secreted protein
MSRNRFAISILKFSVVVLFVVVASCASFAQTASGGIVVTEAQANQTISAHKGEIVTIKLPTQPGTGYSWQFSSNKPKVAAIEGQPEITPDGNSKLGAVETQVFRVRVLRSGKAKLTLKYVRPWEKDAAPQKTFNITLRAQK